MATAKKMDLIGLRVSSENKDIIRMAAKFTGQDLTSYLLSTALNKAKKDIIEHKEIPLGQLMGKQCYLVSICP